MDARAGAGVGKDQRVWTMARVAAIESMQSGIVDLLEAMGVVG